MAKSLSFDTGVVEYDINGAVTVRFNPTDSAFVDRLYHTFADLDAKYDEYQRQVEEIGDDGPKMFAYASARDREMRGMIDALLGDGVADALFQDMNCYALADGLPVWMNLVFAIADEVEAAFESEGGKADPRVREYDERYQQLMRKYQRR